MFGKKYFELQQQINHLRSFIHYEFREFKNNLESTKKELEALKKYLEKGKK